MNRRDFCIGAAAVLIFPPGATARQDGNWNVQTREPEGEPFRVSHRDLFKVPKKFRRQEVAYNGKQPPGSIVIDISRRYLYYVLSDRRALRYGIGVGREGFAWAGLAQVGRKAIWPRWIPPKEMVARDPFAAEWAEGMPGGPDNPLGARALYLYVGGVDTLYRIHGTNQPETIGKAVSSGCVRLLNADIIDLYDRVAMGSSVLVIGADNQIQSLAHVHSPDRSQSAGAGRKIRRHSPRRSRLGDLFDLFNRHWR
jgi:lipoprotein-anchoring transpeptidase ErfK/SrfK